MPTVVYLDDRFLASAAEARVSLFDRGYLFGDSIFETLRGYDGKTFAVAAHLDRLEHASEATGIALPQDRAAIAALVEEAVARSTFASAYVRVTISRGEGGAGIGTIGCRHPILSIVVKEHAGYPKEGYERGIDAMILATRKVPAACLDPAMKTGNYLPNVLARRELERHGMIEGVMLSTTDLVVSGTISNVFFVHGGALSTPDEASGIRPGVTRAYVLEAAKALGLTVRIGPVTRADAASADEAFFTNTLMECMPLRTLDGRELASARADSTMRRVHAAFRELVAG